mmetsp:Transcript_19189/g.49922  ORF Transcript_19189/g.49922 Transcript_19189/m.49922 type:complete len:86 (+) Transcript_19189:158-415(+)
MADEAKAASLAHKRWILEFMKTQPDLKCSYDAIVKEGEKHHCDTLAAMLKLLKRDKVLAYKQMFLMYPMHKDEEVTLINPDYVVE